MSELERIVSLSIDTGFHLHKDLGPGLLESAYEGLLAERLRRSGFRVERQKLLPITFDGLSLPDAYRVDLLINEALIIEVKSCEWLLPVHAKQLLTYLRLARQSLGLLMNFGGETFREGLKRVVNNAAEMKA